MRILRLLIVLSLSVTMSTTLFGDRVRITHSETSLQALPANTINNLDFQFTINEGSMTYKTVSFELKDRSNKSFYLELYQNGRPCLYYRNNGRGSRRSYSSHGRDKKYRITIQNNTIAIYYWLGGRWMQLLAPTRLLLREAPIKYRFYTRRFNYAYYKRHGGYYARHADSLSRRYGYTVTTQITTLADPALANASKAAQDQLAKDKSRLSAAIKATQTAKELAVYTSDYFNTELKKDAFTKAVTANGEAALVTTLFNAAHTALTREVAAQEEVFKVEAYLNTLDFPDPPTGILKRLSINSHLTSLADSRMYRFGRLNPHHCMITFSVAGSGPICFKFYNSTIRQQSGDFRISFGSAPPDAYKVPRTSYLVLGLIIDGSKKTLTYYSTTKKKFVPYPGSSVLGSIPTNVTLADTLNFRKFGRTSPTYYIDVTEVKRIPSPEDLAAAQARKQEYLKKVARMDRTEAMALLKSSRSAGAASADTIKNGIQHSVTEAQVSTKYANALVEETMTAIEAHINSFPPHPPGASQGVSKQIDIDETNSFALRFYMTADKNPGFLVDLYTMARGSTRTTLVRTRLSFTKSQVSITGYSRGSDGRYGSGGRGLDSLEAISFSNKFIEAGGIGTRTWYEILCNKSDLIINATKVDDEGNILARGSITEAGSIFAGNRGGRDPFSNSMQKHDVTKYYRLHVHGGDIITDMAASDYPVTEEGQRPVATDYIDHGVLIAAFKERVATFHKGLASYTRAQIVALDVNALESLRMINGAEARTVLSNAGASAAEIDSTMAGILKESRTYISIRQEAERLIADLTTKANAIKSQNPVPTAEQAVESIGAQAVIDTLTDQGLTDDIARVNALTAKLSDDLNKYHAYKALMDTLPSAVDTFIAQSINTTTQLTALEEISLPVLKQVEDAAIAAGQDLAAVTAQKNRVGVARQGRKEVLEKADITETKLGTVYVALSNENINALSVDDAKKLTATEVEARLDFTTAKAALTAAGRTESVATLDTKRTEIAQYAAQRARNIAKAEELLSALQKTAENRTTQAKGAANVTTAMPAPLSTEEIALVTNALKAAHMTLGEEQQAANKLAQAIEARKEFLTGQASEKLKTLKGEAEKIRLQIAQAQSANELKNKGLTSADDTIAALRAAGMDEAEVTKLVNDIDAELQEAKDSFSNTANRLWVTFKGQYNTLIKNIADMSATALESASLTGSDDVIAALKAAGQSSAPVTDALEDVRQKILDRSKELNDEADTAATNLVQAVKERISDLKSLTEPTLGKVTLPDTSGVTRTFKEANRSTETLIAAQSKLITDAVAVRQNELKKHAAKLLADLTSAVSDIISTKIPNLPKKEVEREKVPGATQAKEAQLEAGNGADGTGLIDEQIRRLSKAKYDRIQELKAASAAAVKKLTDTATKLIAPIDADQINEAQLATTILPENELEAARTALRAADEPLDAVQNQIDRLDAAIEGRRARLSGNAQAQEDAIVKQVPGLLVSIKEMYEPELSKARLQGVDPAVAAFKAAGKATTVIDNSVTQVKEAIAARQQTLRDFADAALQTLTDQEKVFKKTIPAMTAQTLPSAKLSGVQNVRTALIRAGRNEEDVEPYITRIADMVAAQKGVLAKKADDALAAFITQTKNLLETITSMKHADFGKAVLRDVKKTEDALRNAGRAITPVAEQQALIQPALDAQQKALSASAAAALAELTTQFNTLEEQIKNSNNGAGMTHAQLNAPKVVLTSTDEAVQAFIDAGESSSGVILLIKKLNTVKANQHAKLAMRAQSAFDELEEVVDGYLKTIAGAQINEATLKQIEAAGTAEEEAVATQAYKNAGRDAELSQITTEAAQVPAAIKNKRAELTGNANDMLDAFEDTADDIIAGVAKKVEPSLSKTSLPDTQKLVAALDTAGMAGEKATITEKETGLATAISARRQELTNAMNTATEKLKEEAKNLITAIGSMVWHDLGTEKTALKGTEEVTKTYTALNLLATPVLDLEKKVAQEVENQRITLKGVANGALIALQGAVDVVLSQINTIQEDAALDDISVADKEADARTAFKNAGKTDFTSISEQVKRVNDAVVARRDFLAKERARKKLSNLRTKATELKTAISTMDKETVAGVTLSGAEAVKAELIAVGLASQASEVDALVQQVADAVAGRLDILAQAEALRLAQEAAMKKLNEFESRLNGYLSNIPSWKASDLDGITTSDAGSLKEELTAAKLAARVGTVDRLLTEVARAEKARRKVLAQEAALAKLKTFQQTAHGFIGTLNAAESLPTLDAERSKSAAALESAEVLKKELINVDLAPHTSMVDNAVQQTISAYNNRRVTLLKNAAGVALEQLRAEAEKKKRQALEAQTLDELPAATLENVEQVKGALAKTSDLRPELVDQELKGLKTALTKRREEIIAAELKRKQDAAREEFARFKTQAAEKMKAVPTAGEDEIGSITLGDTTTLLGTLTEAKLSTEHAEVLALIKEFNELIAAQEERLAQERAERERIARERRENAIKEITEAVDKAGKEALSVAEALADATRKEREEQDRTAREEEERKAQEAQLKAQRAAAYEKRLRRMRDANGDGGIAAPPQRRQTPSKNGAPIERPYFKTSFYAQGPFAIELAYTNRQTNKPERYRLDFSMSKIVITRGTEEQEITLLDEITKAAPPADTPVFYQLEHYYGRLHLLFHDGESYQTLFSTIDYDFESTVAAFNRGPNGILVTSDNPIHNLVWGPLARETRDTFAATTPPKTEALSSSLAKEKALVKEQAALATQALTAAANKMATAEQVAQDTAKSAITTRLAADKATQEAAQLAAAATDITKSPEERAQLAQQAQEKQKAAEQAARAAAEAQVQSRLAKENVARYQAEQQRRQQQLDAAQKQATELAKREQLEAEAARKRAEIAQRKAAEKEARAQAAAAEVQARLAQETPERKEPEQPAPAVQPTEPIQQTVTPVTKPEIQPITPTEKPEPTKPAIDPIVEPTIPVKTAQPAPAPTEQSTGTPEEKPTEPTAPAKVVTEQPAPTVSPAEEKTAQPESTPAPEEASTAEPEQSEKTQPTETVTTEPAPTAAAVDAPEPAPAWTYLTRATVKGKPGKKLIFAPRGDMPVEFTLKDKNGRDLFFTLDAQGLQRRTADEEEKHLMSENISLALPDAENPVKQTVVVSIQEREYKSSANPGSVAPAVRLSIESFENGQSVGVVDSGIMPDTEPMAQFLLKHARVVSEKEMAAASTPQPTSTGVKTQSGVTLAQGVRPLSALGLRMSPGARATR